MGSYTGHQLAHQGGQAHAVRYRDGEQRNDTPLAEFVAHVQKRIRTRSGEL